VNDIDFLLCVRLEYVNFNTRTLFYLKKIIHFSPRPFRVTTGSANITALPLCRDSMSVFIPQSFLLQVHGLFQSEFFTECDLVLPVSNSRISRFLMVIVQLQLVVCSYLSYFTNAQEYFLGAGRHMSYLTNIAQRFSTLCRLLYVQRAEGKWLATVVI
jgi:hypothetical protein